MKVKIDDYGRIVIPKDVRDRLGIESGSALEIEVEHEEDGGSITLTPERQTPALQQKGELLVHAGTLTEEDFDVARHLRSERQGRARRHAGLDG
jgi:AbrB family looped-hinge helix DNA binding protein